MVDGLNMRMLACFFSWYRKFRLRFLGGFRMRTKRNLKEVNLSLCKELKVMCVCEKCVTNRKRNAREWKKNNPWQSSWYWITSDSPELKKRLVTVSAPMLWVICLPELLRTSVSRKWRSLLNILIEVLRATLFSGEQECMSFWRTIYQMSSRKPSSLLEQLHMWNHLVSDFSIWKLSVAFALSKVQQ